MQIRSERRRFGAMEGRETIEERLASRHYLHEEVSRGSEVGLRSRPGSTAACAAFGRSSVWLGWPNIERDAALSKLLPVGFWNKMRVSSSHTGSQHLSASNGANLHRIQRIVTSRDDHSEALPDFRFSASRSTHRVSKTRTKPTLCQRQNIHDRGVGGYHDAVIAHRSRRLSKHLEFGRLFRSREVKARDDERMRRTSGTLQ